MTDSRSRDQQRPVQAIFIQFKIFPLYHSPLQILALSMAPLSNTRLPVPVQSATILAPALFVVNDTTQPYLPDPNDGLNQGIQPLLFNILGVVLGLAATFLAYLQLRRMVNERICTAFPVLDGGLIR